MRHDHPNPYGDKRRTAARGAIARAAYSMGSAFTVEQLADAVRATEPSLGATATVYRAIAAMLDAGTLERVGAREGHALYTWCSASSHHHHIVCDGCGRTAHAACPLVLESSRDDGFVITRHEVTLYGLCPECANRRPQGD